MSSDIDIRVRDLSKVYRIYEKPEDRLVQMATLGRVRRFTEFPALTGISFDIRRGETVGIVGRNGCGKSTLLQIICGTLQPSAGSVEVTGRISALLELGAGFNGEFTGRENVYMNGAILGFSRAEMDERFAAIADFAGIGDFIERPVKTYSSGMFVRLAFAVATAVEPDILVVDEALSVGDEAFQRKCFARIEAIKARGGTILFVSHGAQTIVQLCDRAILLDGGEKLMEGPPKQVVGQYQRLVNADPEAAEAIRAQIRAIATETTDEATSKAADSKDDINHLYPPSDPEEPPRMGPGGETGDADFWDPSLTSQSAVILEERGAKIRDAHLMQINGSLVNTITSGRNYVFRYSVDYKLAATRVGVGIGIRDLRGLYVGGAQTDLDPSVTLEEVNDGTSILVSIEFRNILLPGVYFISCGTTGVVDGERILMHRCIDVVAFRVRPEPFSLATGLVDISASPRIDVVK